MHGWVTSRHEGWVSTMLTASNFSIALSVRHFKRLYDENGGCKPKSTAFRVLSVWTSRGCDCGSRRTYLLSLICIKPRRSARIHRFGQTPWCPVRREWPDAAQLQTLSFASQFARQRPSAPAHQSSGGGGSAVCQVADISGGRVQIEDSDDYLARLRIAAKPAIAKSAPSMPIAHSESVGIPIPRGTTRVTTTFSFTALQVFAVAALLASPL
jgi:hypothetical protein